MSAGLPSTSQIETGLLPGDQLLQVNGQSVEALTRDEVIRLIRDSADTVTLVVRPVPELSELTIRAQQTSEALVEDEADGDSADLLLPTTALTSRRKEVSVPRLSPSFSPPKYTQYIRNKPTLSSASYRSTWSAVAAVMQRPRCECAL